MDSKVLASLILVAGLLAAVALAVVLPKRLAGMECEVLTERLCAENKMPDCAFKMLAVCLTERMKRP